MHLFDWFGDSSAWIALLTLTILEIVLGVDNIVFISILSGKLPPEQQQKARQLGLLLALGSRLVLLASINWVKNAVYPVFIVPFAGLAKEMAEVSWRDMILLGGGLFLIFKAVKEIHHKLEGHEEEHEVTKVPSFGAVLLQILILDVVFSLDSVITAVGMADNLGVMVTAVVLAVGFMLVFAGSISSYVAKHPTIKVLALAFLVLIGANLVAEGCGQHIPKGYTYFAMAFAVIVEILNLRMRKGPAAPVP